MIWHYGIFQYICKKNIHDHLRWSWMNPQLYCVQHRSRRWRKKTQHRCPDITRHWRVFIIISKIKHCVCVAVARLNPGTHVRRRSISWARPPSTVFAQFAVCRGIFKIIRTYVWFWWFVTMWRITSLEDNWQKIYLECRYDAFEIFHQKKFNLVVTLKHCLRELPRWLDASTTSVKFLWTFV